MLVLTFRELVPDVSEAGVKVAETPPGSPVIERLTGELYPPLVVRVTV